VRAENDVRGELRAAGCGAGELATGRGELRRIGRWRTALRAVWGNCNPERVALSATARIATDDALSNPATQLPAPRTAPGASKPHELRRAKRPARSALAQR
jgi:hypothetical protein